jgi:phage gp29-like protein
MLRFALELYGVLPVRAGFYNAGADDAQRFFPLGNLKLNLISRGKAQLGHDNQAGTCLAGAYDRGFTFRFIF